VVVKVEYAVVADIAVRCALRPENHARLAELEPIELRRMAPCVKVTHIEVVNALRFANYGLIPLVYPAYRFLIEELEVVDQGLH